MKKDSKIYVAGHRGMVGSAIVRCLKADGIQLAYKDFLSHYTSKQRYNHKDV